MTLKFVLDAVCGAENGDAGAVQSACNALAFVRCLLNTPKLRGGVGYALILRMMLLPVLQCIAKSGKRDSHATVCLELTSLVQAAIPDAELLPPSANGSLHPGPHHSVPAHAALGWYALQQAILCSLQVCPIRTHSKECHHSRKDSQMSTYFLSFLHVSVLCAGFNGSVVFASARNSVCAAAGGCVPSTTCHHSCRSRSLLVAGPKSFCEYPSKSC